MNVRGVIASISKALLDKDATTQLPALIRSFVAMYVNGRAKAVPQPETLLLTIDLALQTFTFPLHIAANVLLLVAPSTIHMLQAHLKITQTVPEEIRDTLLARWQVASHLSPFYSLPLYPQSTTRNSVRILPVGSTVSLYNAKGARLVGKLLYIDDRMATLALAVPSGQEVPTRVEIHPHFPVYLLEASSQRQRVDCPQRCTRRFLVPPEKGNLDRLVESIVNST